MPFPDSITERPIAVKELIQFRPNPVLYSVGRKTLLYRLIIADDEETIRNGLTQYFPWNQVGFEVVATCANGAEVLQFLNTHEADVLFCDIRMKNTSGIELAEQLRRNGNRMVIVFLSAYRDFEYAQEAVRLGVRQYLVKPTRHSELFQVFGNLKDELDAAGPDAIIARSTPEEIVDSVRHYAQKHLAVATLEEASRMVGMNPHYFSRLFKEQSGENYSTFIGRLRMERAAELLATTGLPGYEIGGMVGYTNPKAFTRRFREYFGQTPGTYRKSACRNLISGGHSVRSLEE
ncbi:MAG: response regulator [Spirochaetaceae bacterium]|nr:MAG: response regulator [Spirochaetaceae bacterium]